MYLNKLFENLKRQPNPDKSLDKLAEVIDEHKHELHDMGLTSLKTRFCNGVYEAINGPHFDEEHALEAVKGMENEDGSKGAHWTVEETTSVANQMAIDLISDKFNKWDWYVAMNMVYSDFYKTITSIAGTNSTKLFAEFTKAWLNDKDVSEGKMWHYYTYIMSCKKSNKETSTTAIKHF